MKKLFFLLFTSCLFATNSFVVAATQIGMDREWLNVQKRVSDRKINLEQTSDLIGQQREEILTKLKSKYEEMKKAAQGKSDTGSHTEAEDRSCRPELPYRAGTETPK